MMHGRGYFDNYGYFGHGYYNGWEPFIGIGILLIVLAVVYLLVKRTRKAALNSNVIELLKLKYVKGEITEEEYLKQKKVLNEINY